MVRHQDDRLQLRYGISSENNSNHGTTASPALLSLLSYNLSDIRKRLGFFSSTQHPSIGFQLLLTLIYADFWGCCCCCRWPCCCCVWGACCCICSCWSWSIWELICCCSPFGIRPSVISPVASFRRWTSAVNASFRAAQSIHMNQITLQEEKI